ncbi:DUF4349 domain-containing protein [Flexithrix dorotheae]|uniref:DUF4349 domain-containing protein n=1 Tax=Flexithrix dorotheae TaxID=70993 RepID=UPI000477A8D9|nr:DUF4349 domain-containing protein [Flexithrix dorotheae]
MKLNFFPKILFVFLIMAAACQSNQAYKESVVSSDMVLDEEYEEGEMPQNESEIEGEVMERKLIKEGNISFETDDLEHTKTRINVAIKKYKAYLASENSYNYDTSIRQTLTIRVPSQNFDSLLAAIAEGVGHFDQRNIQIQDVTEEFLDITARIKTKKELENRYLDLLKEAKKVTEILEIERELGKIREEIESVEGRLKYLSNQVNFSTLTVSFYQTVSGGEGFFSQIKDGFSNGWENLGFVFIGLVNIWPFLILIILVVWGINRWRKSKKTNN